MYDISIKCHMYIKCFVKTNRLVKSRYKTGFHFYYDLDLDMLTNTPEQSDFLGFTLFSPLLPWSNI